MIDAIWENRTIEDYETTSSTVKTDFMRKWHHNRSGKPISLDEMMENKDGDIFEVADPRGEFEQKVISEMKTRSRAGKVINQPIGQCEMYSAHRLGRFHRKITSLFQFKS